jgi:adenine specific DNA methylase Mod
MIWPRLELLRALLPEDGSIRVSTDDNEGHYLKVIMDEVSGGKISSLRMAHEPDLHRSVRTS